MIQVRYLSFMVFILCALSSVSLAQDQGQSGQQQQASSGDVIQIEAQILDARVELPQVQILDKRKKVQFEEVKVEKSFRSELSARTEELKFTPNTSGKIKRIKDIEALLNKNRF